MATCNEPPMTKEREREIFEEVYRYVFGPVMATLTLGPCDDLGQPLDG